LQEKEIFTCFIGIFLWKSRTKGKFSEMISFLPFFFILNEKNVVTRKMTTLFLTDFENITTLPLIMNDRV